MTTYPTSFKPVSTGQPLASGAPDERAGAPKFNRPAKDHAPEVAGSNPLPTIDPNASAAEQAFFNRATDLAQGDMPGIAVRFMLVLRNEGAGASMRETIHVRSKNRPAFKHKVRE